MSISEFLASLAVPPSSVAYHLIRLAVLTASLLLVRDRYQGIHTRSDRMTAGGLAGALALQLGPLFLALAGLDESVEAIGALEVLIAGALVWGLALPSLGRSSLIRYSPFFLGAAVLGVGLFWSNGSSLLWAVATSVVFGFGSVILAWRRNVINWFSLALALLLLGLASLVPLWDPGSPPIEGAGRLTALVGYLMLAAALYQQTIEAWQAEQEALSGGLQSLSRDSLQQTQERLFLLQVSRAISVSLDLRTVLDKAAESLVFGGQVDKTFIALGDEDDTDHMWVVASHAPLSLQTSHTRRIHIHIPDFPFIQEAVTRHEAIIIQDDEPDPKVTELHDLLESLKAGPLLIQPLIHQDKLIGLVLLSNTASGRLFTEQDRSFCSALSSQITGAISNALLYQRVSLLLQELASDASQRQAILESIADGVIATDQKGIIILVNPAAARILHQEISGLQGQSLEAVCPALWRDGKPGQSSFEVNGQVIMGNLTWVKQTRSKKRGFVAVLRDITQETQAERAKTSFIATVSHELRTPMTSIKGYADLIDSGFAGDLTENQRDFVGIILSNTERMVSIVNNMISVSEMEGEVDLTPEILEMRPLIEREIQAIRPELEKRQLVLDFDAPPEIPPVLGDRLRLRQVINNLLSNACKYNRAGGRVSVKVRLLPAGVSGDDSKRYLVVSISDTGIGIPPEDQTRIFERFFRAETPISVEAGGPGVGLTIAKELVERHGGRIWVESKAGQGSTFTFIIPLAS